MAKIIISISGNRLSTKEEYKIFPFYEGLMNALKRNGNDVYYMIINDFVASYNSRSNKTNPHIDIERIDEEIARINPDMIIAFNNAAYEKLKNLNCPYIVWGVDPISVYADKDELRKNSDRYIFATNCLDDYVSVGNYFETKNVLILPYATDVYPQNNVSQDVPISFVGSLWDGEIKSLLEKGVPVTSVKKIVETLRQDTQLSLEDLRKITGVDHPALKESSVFRLLHGIAASDRAKVLTGLTDLGLKVYGLTNNWTALANNNLDLALSYDSKVVYSLSEIERLYNSSKICFNMSHIHARGDGFSFRVIDTMASNGCLVTDYKEGYKKLFGKYVELPTFEYGDVAGAQKICRYVLENDSYRQDIVAASQQAINAEYRFEHRFLEIEKIIGVKLLNSQSIGSIKRINPIYIKTINEAHSTHDVLNKNSKKIALSILVKVYNFLFKRKKNYFKKQFKKLHEKLDHNFKQLKPTLRANSSMGPFNPDIYLARVSRGYVDARKATDKIRVLFLFQEASYWSSVKTLYEALKNDPAFEVSVLAIPVFKLPCMSGPYLLDHQIEFLESNGIEYIDARLIYSTLMDPYTLRPDYIFTQIHFDAQRPFIYRADVMRLYSKVCLVPHAFLLSESDNMELAHQSDYFKIFATDQSHADTLKRVLRHDRNIAVTGWPRFDNYHFSEHDESLWKISRNDNKNVKRIIWSPHWWVYGHTLEAFQSVDAIWTYLYKTLQTNLDLEVIMKPHPNLFNGLVAAGYMTQNELDERISAFNMVSNGSVYSGGNYFDLFITSDGMINNSVSFLAEYLPSEKPMLFVDGSRKFELNSLAKEIISHYYNGTNLSDVEKFINEVIISGKDNMKEKRVSLLKKLEILQTEKASEKIKKVLKDSLNDPY